MEQYPHPDTQAEQHEHEIQTEFLFPDKQNQILEKCGLDPTQFEATTAPFKLSYVYNIAPPGLDVSNPQSGERLFITTESDHVSEATARTTLGKASVLEHLYDRGVGPERHYQIYKVPKLAQPIDEFRHDLSITFEQEKSLVNKVNAQIARFAALGIRVTSKQVAIVDHRAEEGADVDKPFELVVVPPIKNSRYLQFPRDIIDRMFKP